LATGAGEVSKPINFRTRKPQCANACGFFNAAQAATRRAGAGAVRRWHDGDYVDRTRHDRARLRSFLGMALATTQYFRMNPIFQAYMVLTSRLKPALTYAPKQFFVPKLLAPCMSEPSAEYILAHADRLIIVAARCAFSFGSADGLNDLLLMQDDPHGDWRQPVAVLHRDGLMMAALRVSILLDRNDQMLSFQAVNRLLKDPVVVGALLLALEARRGPDIYQPSRIALIEEWHKIYSEIDWKVHGRLVHLRNRGIAHLTPEEMTKSVTMEEIRTLVGIVSRLTATLQQLCQTETGFRTDISDEYRTMARKAMRRTKP
jgi:hypothetical protein